MVNESNESTRSREVGGRSIVPLEPEALASRCSLCFHSAAFHADAGCQAVLPSNARSGPRPCYCERDVMAAAYAKTRRLRHLTVIK